MGIVCGAFACVLGGIALNSFGVPQGGNPRQAATEAGMVTGAALSLGIGEDMWFTAIRRAGRRMGKSRCLRR